MDMFTWRSFLFVASKIGSIKQTNLLGENVISNQIAYSVLWSWFCVRSMLFYKHESYHLGISMDPMKIGELRRSLTNDMLRYETA